MSTPKVRKAKGEAGPASAKKAKLNVKNEHVDSKKPATDKITANPLGQIATDAPFAWRTAASERDAFKRLEVKEEAFRQGLRYADRIRSILGPGDGTPSPYSRATELRNWQAQLDDLKKKDSEFRVFIGFAGVTGAGKTSAINSIIDFPDLLPSSNEAAATAVPCLIAYNDDPNPDATFRAEVTFRTEDDIRKELDYYFDALEALKEFKSSIESDDAEPAAASGPAKANKPMEHLKDLDVIEEDNQDLLDIVSAAFGLDEEALQSESTDSLLEKRPDVRNLLGRTLSIAGSNLEEFSESIKPYMDSVPAAHGTSGVEFAAWPLINEVKVFVCSNVLKNGVVLVDLPGLADNVESRASVAQNYFSKLSVTAVVAPIIRARNEQTAVNLMTENQQYQMQMDGKFHKKSFCVILSKMDDINVETYLKQHATEARLDRDLLTCRATLKTLDHDFKEIERGKSANKQELRRLRQNSKDRGDKDTKARLEAKAAAIALDRRLQKNRKQAKFLEGKILHWCIHARNSLVKKEIQKDFKRRQERLSMEHLRHDLYDGTVKTFPISSSAYWKAARDSETPAGFPAVEYTGIPAVKHWLRYAAIGDREKHLDMGLNVLHGLFNTMQAWSSFEFQGELSLTKKFVNAEVLHRPLHNFETALNKTFNSLCNEIKAKNPVKNKAHTLANCKERCIAVVGHWSSREPNNMLCKTKMRWNTYNACVTRNGCPYNAKTQGRPRYAWIESLCNLFYEDIVKEWNLALNEEIPALRAPGSGDIDKIWGTLIQQLQKRARIVAPQMQQLLDADGEKLDQIKDQLKDLVGQQFDSIRVGSSKAHKTLAPSVKEKWEPAFKKAQKERGKGMYERQQGHLIRYAEWRGSSTFKLSTEKISTRLDEQFKTLRQEFHAITKVTRTRLRDLIMVMLNLDGMAKTEDGKKAVVVWTAHRSKQEVQQATRLVMLEWAAKWCIGTATDIDMRAKDTAIPEIYYDDAEDAKDSDSSDSDELEDEAYKEFLAGEAEAEVKF